MKAHISGETLSGRLASTDQAVKNSKKNVTYYEHFKDIVNVQMAKIFFFGFLGALIYIIFPVVNAQGATNYWAYFLAKEMWWSWFGNSTFVELYEIALPGAPTWVYVYAYFFGYMLPPAIHILAYFLNATANTTLNTMALTAALIVTTVCYGSWYLFLEKPDTENEFYNIVAKGGTASGRPSGISKGVTFDIFSAVWDARDTEVVARLSTRNSGVLPSAADTSGGMNSKPSEMSDFRTQWLKTMRRFQVVQHRRETEVLRHSEAMAIAKSSQMAAIGQGTSNPMLHSPTDVADNMDGHSSASRTSVAMEAGGVESESKDGEKSSTTDTDAEAEDLIVVEEDEDSAIDYEDRQSTTVFGDEEPRFTGLFYWLPNFIADHNLLPRFYLKGMMDARYSAITAPNRYKHFLTTFLFVFGWVVTYFIFMFFTFSFRLSDKKDRAGWFLGFTFGAVICKASMKQLGLAVDQGKLGTSSMFFIAEYLVTLFYYAFYRMLFEEFVSWPVFTLLQIVHLIMEWVFYCGRATTGFYKFVTSLHWIFTPIKNMVLMKGLAHRDWQVFLALDFAMRVGVMVMSAPVSHIYP